MRASQKLKLTLNPTNGINLLFSLKSNFRLISLDWIFSVDIPVKISTIFPEFLSVWQLKLFLSTLLFNDDNFEWTPSPFSIYKCLNILSF